MYLNSNIVDPDVKLVVEYLIVVREPNPDQQLEVDAIVPEAPKFKDFKRFGIGFTVLTIFDKIANSPVQMKQGTARSLLSDRVIENYTSNGCTVEFQIKDDLKESKHLSNLVSLNCLVGPNDFLPGLQTSYLP